MKLNIEKSNNKKAWLLSAAVTVYLLFLLTGCDCWNCGNGIVVDSITLKPVKGVTAKSFGRKVSDKSYYVEMVTDSTGKFEGTTGNTGFCHDLIIELSKTGYKTTTIRNPNDITVRLEKE